MVTTAHTAADAGVGGVGAAGVAVAVHGEQHGRAGGGDGGGDGGGGGDGAAARCRPVFEALRLRRRPRLGADGGGIGGRRRPRHRPGRLLALFRQGRAFARP